MEPKVKILRTILSLEFCFGSSFDLETNILDSKLVNGDLVAFWLG